MFQSVTIKSPAWLSPRLREEREGSAAVQGAARGSGRERSSLPVGTHPPSPPPPEHSPPTARITSLNLTNLAVCFIRAEVAFLIAGKRSGFETEIDAK